MTKYAGITLIITALFGLAFAITKQFEKSNTIEIVQWIFIIFGLISLIISFIFWIKKNNYMTLGVTI